MSYYGSWKINDTLVFVANTHNPTNGMATNADAVPSYHVYEDETATPILTGTMALLNNPNTIGFYSEQITLSAANGLEKGKSYNIYIRAVVSGVTGTMSHSFQMEAEVDANTVSVPVTAGMVTGSVLGNVNGNVVGNVLGNVNGSVASVGTPVTVGTNNDKTGYTLSSPQSVNFIGNISGTITNALNVVNPVVAGVVTGSVLGNVNGSVGSVSGNVGGNVVGNVNGNVVGSVGSVAGNVAGSVNSVTNPVTAGNVTGSVFGNVNGSIGSVVQPVGISTGSFISAVADGVWDETISGHLTAGSTGEKLNSAGSAGDPWGTALPGSYTAGQAGHILASRMPTGTVSSDITAIKAKTDNLPADPADASDIAASFTTVNSKLDAIDDFVDSEVSAIKTKTDQLTFTKPGELDSNIQSVNDTSLTGDGSTTPWGPA